MHNILIKFSFSTFSINPKRYAYLNGIESHAMRRYGSNKFAVLQGAEVLELLRNVPEVKRGDEGEAGGLLQAVYHVILHVLF